jgi:hypothetical protein
MKGTILIAKTIALAEIVSIADDIELNNEIIAEIVNTDKNEVGLPLLIVAVESKECEILTKIVIFYSFIFTTLVTLILLYSFKIIE